MKEQHITVSKTARYYILGELNAETKHIWFVIHGFAQLAGNFLKDFEPLANNETVFIAPEGLNRFYTKGHAGNVVATWMTKEDRLNEIKDYINYLDTLYQSLQLEKYPYTKITALGFSQGSSTLTRWLANTKHKIDTAVFYAGEVPIEIFPLRDGSILKTTKNYYIYGDKDEVIPAELFDKVLDAIKELNLHVIKFDGKHEIKTETLKGLL